MFGYTTGCTIKNITFSGVNITGTDDYTGIIGYMINSSVTNVTVTGGVITGESVVGGICAKTDGTISHCTNRAQVTGNYDVGGICGKSDGTIEYCTNYGAVTGTGNYNSSIGGIVGGAQRGGSISHCANYGNVEGDSEVGGILGSGGYGTFSLANVISTGNVTETSSDNTAGMVVGCVQGQLTLSDFAVFNSDATLTLNGTAQTARGIGNIYSSGSVSSETAGYTTDQLQSGMVTYLLQSVAPAGKWGQQLGTNAYPLLGSAHTVYAAGDIAITCAGSISGGSFSNTRPATGATVTFSHGTITHHAAVEKTCTSDGNVEYWHCESCEKDYTDDELTVETDDPVLHATGHNYNYTAGSCTVCSEVIPSITEGTHTIQIAAVSGDELEIDGYNLYRFVAPGDGDLTVKTRTAGTAMLTNVKKTFKPEFINRLSAVTVFNDMNKDMAERVLNKKLRSLQQKLEAKNISLTLEFDAKEFLLSKGFSPEYGGREIDRVISTCLKPILMKALLHKKLVSGSIATIVVENAELKLKE